LCPDLEGCGFGLGLEGCGFDLDLEGCGFVNITDFAVYFYIVYK